MMDAWERAHEAGSMAGVGSADFSGLEKELGFRPEHRVDRTTDLVGFATIVTGAKSREAS